MAVDRIRKIREELRFNIFIVTIIITIMIGATNLLAQKIFYEDRINGLEVKVTQLKIANKNQEERLEENDKFNKVFLEALRIQGLNIINVCKEAGIEYQELPEINGIDD